LIEAGFILNRLTSPERAKKNTKIAAPYSRYFCVQHERSFSNLGGMMKKNYASKLLEKSLS
jgi:hypothetical protein